MAGAHRWKADKSGMFFLVSERLMPLRLEELERME
jgi:hypothetical protein